VAETAALVSEAGGKGIPICIDHSNDEAVAELFALVGRDHGRLGLTGQQRGEGGRRDTARRVLGEAFGGGRP